MESVELQISEWRKYITTAPAVDGHDVEELEGHLRDQISELNAGGLTDDEAFLVAVKRMGDIDSLSREFAREHRSRLWKQLVLSADGDQGRSTSSWLLPLGFAVVAAIVLQVALRSGGFPDEPSPWVVRNLGLFVLPFLAGYFAWLRQIDVRQWMLAAVPFVLAALAVNLYPYSEDSATELLVALHLPVVLWFAVAYPYLGGRSGAGEERMDFVRFTGEWFIYYVLIALGGGVLMALTALILDPIGPEIAERVVEWVLPSGAAGAVIVAAWLVESKQRVVENMAPVLTMIFTPLFALMLTVAAVTYAVSGVASEFDRELLGVFDALLVVVLGLVLYSMSAREASGASSLMDRAQLLAVAAALALDVMVLGAMLVRIGDLGFTPNRVAALGLNLVLLVNLAVTAWLLTRFLLGRGALHPLERWQTSYLPVFALWAAIVVLLLPPLFGFN